MFSALGLYELFTERADVSVMISSGTDLRELATLAVQN